MMRIAVIGAFLVFLISCRDRNPVVVDQAGIIVGTVMNGENNIAMGAAEIITDPKTRTSLTDSLGNFAIVDVPEGSYLVIAFKSGFESETTSVHVKPGLTVRADFRLVTGFGPVPLSINLWTIYVNKITNYVGQELFIKSKVVWESVVGKTTSGESTDSVHTSPLSIHFETGFKYVNSTVRSENRENIVIVSNAITKLQDESGCGTYSYEGFPLDTGIVCFLRGVIAYQDSLNTDSAKLSDPVFLEQCNDVTYWRERFKFCLIDVSGIRR